MYGNYKWNRVHPNVFFFLFLNTDTKTDKFFIATDHVHMVIASRHHLIAKIQVF